MSEERARLVSALLVAVAAVELIHGLDSLRTDDEATLAGVLLAPQSLAGIGGSIVAAVMIRRGRPSGRFLGTLAAGLVALGFVVVHGLPWKADATEPYWGEGSADALQWLGVLTILALCGSVLALLHGRADVAAVPEPAAAPAPASPGRRPRPLVATRDRT